MIFKTIPLTFEEIYPGMRIQDKDGDIAVVKKCFDNHNIIVELECHTGGYAFYCLDKNCKDYDEIYEQDFSPESQCEMLICKKCGEAVYMYNDTQLCPKCKEVIHL